ncbi:PRC-barrel domain containing protein [Salipiger sp. IMCC34102]|uniref:PRC-barrel domain-containing protein n=1 Tax=Salipiger sp. IMCC34102 TaxID=2510647 RepID=UPI00101CB29C|nr:PRC-barrel domain-containing protein [Salipiger sp. IMCC34102]RYH03879.1 PRC-barrel domain containing protein [Salipiger sp. IMCC34102]
MKRFTALALVATLAGGSAMAQDAMSTDNLIRSRDITGGDVYTTNTDMDDTSWDSMDVGTMDDGWNDIGEIEDLVLDQNGQMVGVVAEIGGFLDIGDKHVMIEMNDIKLAPVDDRSYALVVRQTEEQLEQLPSVDESFLD